MKNILIAASLLLTASASQAQTDTTVLYATASHGFNRSLSSYAQYTEPDVKDEKVNKEIHPTDSAKADAEKLSAPDSAENETAKQFAFSERSASNYLVGTWTVKDTSNHLPPMSLTFDDSMHVKLLLGKEGAAHLTYSVDKYHNQVVLHFEGKNCRNVKTHMYWFIKVLDNKTIEAEQPFYSPRTYKWNEAIAITVVKQS